MDEKGTLSVFTTSATDSTNQRICVSATLNCKLKASYKMLYSCTGEFLPLLADCSFSSVLNYVNYVNYINYVNYVNMSRFQQSKIPKLNGMFKAVKESLDFRDNFANLTCCTFLLDVRLSFKERSLKYKNSY